MLPIPAPLTQFSDNDGYALDSGYIYIGQVNDNPETAPLTVYWDAAGTQPAAQPLRTIGGFITRNGTPANIYIDSAYSITIKNKNGVLIFYGADSNKFDSSVAVGGIGNNIQRVVKSIAELRALSKAAFGQAIVMGYYVPGDGGGGSYFYDSADISSMDNGGTIIIANDGGRWKLAPINSISVRQFGAKGDGVTDDTASITAAKLALSSGGELRFNRGTYLISSANALSITSANFTMSGDGPGTVIKAKDSSAMATLVTSSAAGFSMKSLVLDGNRNANGLTASSYLLYLGASMARITNVEIRFATAYAIFLGSSTATPSGLVIENCWIHDNGGITTTTGFGVGIYGGGTFLPDDVRVQNCRIENNYNTVTGYPGDSTATNITGTNIIVDGCFIKNNHNIGGGQIVVSSDASSGSSPGRHVISNNTIVHSVIFGGESTCGIEVASRKFVVSNNVIQSLNGDGVRIETSGGDGVVNGNVIDCTSVGVNLIATGGVGIQKTLVNDNLILSAGTAIQVQPGPGNVLLVDNYFDSSIPNRIVGPENCTLIRGNVGYNPNNQIGAIAGASPYIFPILNYDATYSCQAANGIFSANINGVNVSITALVPIFVKAGKSFSVSWSGTAPTYSIAPQQ